ncbi:hypothetical protein DPMN_106973 [Dreissena polymorpha]|uniref:Uncharacterized protein n=1 Tax=Dreissena polymorpha TaxID=45954 RepID=A0A9D4K5X1_DREPO|nr:hypothetical protein DPMN_106973 [Dreissena polymorpha]
MVQEGGAEIAALNDWRTKVFGFAMNEVCFCDTNPLALPRSPGFDRQSLCKLLVDLESKFVLVPADKVADGVIMV